MKAKILRTDAELFIIEQYLDELAAVADVVTTQSTDEDALALEATDAEIILTCYTAITEKVIEAAKNLKGIVKYGVGTDAIDIEAATQRGVMVINCPDYGSDTVADHAFALLIALARRIPVLDRVMQENAWAWPAAEYLGVDLSGKTIGLVGFGRIGRCIARRAEGFSMTRLATDPYVDFAIFDEYGVQSAGLDEMLERSDFVSIHCVLTPETTGLIGEAELKRMKDTAFLIDVSRGAIIDEGALIRALDENAIAGAAFDVFADEPLALGFPLLGRDNVILTPHLAWYTKEAFERVERDTLDGVRDVLSGNRPKNLKNVEVLGFLVAFFISLVLPWNPTEAREIDHAHQYKACMALAKKSPEEAFETALTWRDLGGGDAAEHCVAAALIGLGQYTDAAGRMETLAGKAKQNSSVKAGLLAHAAQAWLLADQAARAEAVLTAALKLTPEDSALFVDRADRRAAAYVFRAATYRFLDKPDLALADVERALALAPTHAEGLLERGILRRLRQDNDGARQDWLRVLRLAPKSRAADASRRNLEKMDVKPDEPQR